MKKISVLYLSLFSIAFVLSCEENKINWLFPSGITVTNDVGEILHREADDWCLGLAQPYGLEAGLPTNYHFGPAYPNPSTDRIIIPYALPQAEWVRLWIVDKYGQDVIVLVEGVETAGYKSVKWTFDNSKGEKVIPGIYRALILAGGYACYGDILAE